jgi:hypothetical protein
VYRVEPVGEDIASAITPLPREFLAAFAEVRVALEVAPWTVGQPYNPTNPTGSRSAMFGPDERGLIIYSVEDSDRRVVWLWAVLVVPRL